VSARSDPASMGAGIPAILPGQAPRDRERQRPHPSRRSGYQGIWSWGYWQLAPIGWMIEECRQSWTIMRNVTG
jgi:hypothetical protein